MGREGDWVGKNVDLKKLAAGVDRFFKDDGFHEIRVDEDPHGSWFQIQAKKIGALRTVVSSRKAIHVIIKGEPNKFIVSVGTGEWGKNFAVAGLFTGGVGLIGMGFNLRFTTKLWNHVKELVASLENSYVKPVLPVEDEDPLKALKMRFVNGEITAEEYERMKGILEG